MVFILRHEVRRVVSCVQCGQFKVHKCLFHRSCVSLYSAQGQRIMSILSVGSFSRGLPHERGKLLLACSFLRVFLPLLIDGNDFFHLGPDLGADGSKLRLKAASWSKTFLSSFLVLACLLVNPADIGVIAQNLLLLALVVLLLLRLLLVPGGGGGGSGGELSALAFVEGVAFD